MSEKDDSRLRTSSDFNQEGLRELAEYNLRKNTWELALDFLIHNLTPVEKDRKSGQARRLTSSNSN